MNKNGIHIDSLHRSFEEVRALNNISMDIERGELFGLIGPDGAGKTTLFRILTTLLLPDVGSAIMEGLDVVRDFREIRKITGYMPGRFSLYQDLTVEENLNFYATVFGTTVEENYELVKDIYAHIEPYRKRRAGKLSGGMKQKLALSCALIHRPRILILDEPTTGVDAVSRKEFWEMLLRLQGSDLTILVSTPYMDEAMLCSRVALMQHGSILAVDSPGNIIRDYQPQIWAVSSADLYRLKQDIESWDNARSVYLFGRELHITLLREEKGDKLIEEYLESRSFEDFSIRKIDPGIEDCFMELMRL